MSDEVKITVDELNERLEEIKDESAKIHISLLHQQNHELQRWAIDRDAAINIRINEIKRLVDEMANNIAIMGNMGQEVLTKQSKEEETAIVKPGPFSPRP